MEKPAGYVQQTRTASMGEDTAAAAAAARELAPAMPHRSIDHSRGLSMHSACQERVSNDVWTSAISRLQAQVSYNTGMLESHRRQFTEIESAIGRLGQQMGEVVHAVDDVQRALRARPLAGEQLPRHDSGDLEVLAGQLQRLTNRVNEIDGLNMQLDLVKNRVKRLEEGGATVASTPHKPSADAYSREQASQDTALPTYPQQQRQQEAHHYQHQQQTLPPPQHVPLPPMRTSSVSSPSASRPPYFPAASTLASQSTHSLRPSSESRPFSAEQNSGQPSSGPQLRPGETLPPPSTLSGWRPADHHGLPAISSPNAPPSARSTPREPDVHSMHSSQTSGWTSADGNAAVKRPPEDRASPYQSPSLDGSKRPRLAPLMPGSVLRSTQGAEPYGTAHSGFQSMASGAAEVPFHPRSRAPSDGTQQHSAVTPGPSSGQHSFRFITSAQQVDGPPEMYRPDMASLTQHAHSIGGGRRGPGRGRGRGRGRFGAERHGSGHEGQEHSVSDWERPGTLTSFSSPSSGHQPLYPQPHSPRSAYRSTSGGRVGSFMGGLPPERPSDYPVTPANPGSPHDSHSMLQDPTSGGSGKKTRTKPIRNAEGILIRKDGRPDMRSVSSANNLRKVHAKKEAERADVDGKQIPVNIC